MRLSRLARAAIHSVIWSMALLYATWSAASIAQVIAPTDDAPAASSTVVNTPGAATTKVSVQPNPADIHSSKVVTTVQTPGSSVRTTVTSIVPKSRVVKTSEGATLALGSDSSVNVVYPDGARTTANDGTYTLIDGQRC